METKTLAFDVRDIEQFKEFFPEFKSGKMTGRELGRKLIEVLQQGSTIQVNEEPFKQLQEKFQELQTRCKQLEAQLVKQNINTSKGIENQNLQEFQESLQQELQQVLQERDDFKEKFQKLQIDNQRLAELQEASSREFQEKLQNLQNLQIDNQQLAELQQALQERDDLQSKLQDLQADNQQLAELQETSSSNFQSQLQDLQDKNATLEARCKDLKAQLKEAASHQDAYTFTPYFKQLVAVVADKINAISKTVYTPTDVIMQTLFATYFNSHISIKYTYPISKQEMLALAEAFYPEVKNYDDLFEVLIYKVKA